MSNNRFDEWLDFAYGDWLSAKHLHDTMHPPRYEVICYLCQQSAEKYLKGYLIFCGNDEPPKTHNLSRLCVLCSEHSTKFNDILKICDFLTAFAVQSRYPDEIYIDKDITEKAIDYAGKIKDFVTNIVNE